ncbi:hypothetical protein EC957_007144 [Mortierella hygrophila]|uniref:Uncharacterized protein n=1 Tax=Mortierella hygrophila TaxID=979708 RepID=A0A9P6FDM1_9FUNG|nr:hypothetical protein EC957_007144 [Mortierella hygrophila]
MVSLVLLILAPVLILTAVVVTGVALFAPGASNPKPKVTPTLTTPLVLTPEVIFTTRILPEKGEVTKTSLLPSNIATTTPPHPFVDKIPSSSLSSATVITTTKVPDVVTATSKVPEVITPTSAALPSPPPIAVPTTTADAKVIPILVPVPDLAPALAVPSDKNIKEKNKDDKDKKDDNEEEDEEDDWEDDDEDDEDDEEDNEEEEEDESYNVNDTTAIPAVNASDSRHVETVKYEGGSDKHRSSINKKKRTVRMRRSVALKQGEQVIDSQAKSTNENNKGKKPAVVEELQKRIDGIVKEKSAPFEAELFRIMTDLLDSQDAIEYQDVLSHIEATTRQEDSGSSVNDNKDADTQAKFYAQDDTTHAPASGFDPRALLNTLLQPFVIQFRTDVRNTVIFICGSQHDGVIDGKINGNDDYAKKAAQDDIIATTHSDGVHFTDLYDPKTAALALDCLKTHFGHLTTALGKLLVDRFAAAKEFLLKQVAGLAGVPRFLIPFSEEGKDKGAADFVSAVAVAPGDSSMSSEEEKKRVERSGAFAKWLVDSMVHEFQLAVEHDQELASGGRSNIASVANLPDAEEEKEEEEEVSRPLVAREPPQPRI